MRKDEELHLFSLEKAQGIITLFQYLNGSSKEDGRSLSTGSLMKEKRDNRYRLDRRCFILV